MKTKAFIYSAGAILLACSVERILIASGNAWVLSMPEPLMGVPIRYASFIVAGIELWGALICLFGRNSTLQLGWIGWLAIDYIVYRIGLSMMHVYPQGSGIGCLTDPLHLSRGFSSGLINLAPVYLLLGSGVAFVCQWKKQPKVAVQESIKMPCASCGVRIEFASGDIGKKIRCPKCEQVITLRRPENLKDSCFFCKGHIEFPSYAIGQQTKCPHCAMDILLKEPATA